MAARQTSIGRRYIVNGKVQGVGFRDFVQREARNLKLSGYVRNLSDGGVLVCAKGSQDSIEALESALRRGPRWSEVRDLAVEELELEQFFDDFRIVV